VALALSHREIPPSLHFRQPSPHIPFDSLPLRVLQTLGTWPTGSGPARAGVSSFGFGGTNAHVVLEEAPASAAEKTDNEVREAQLCLPPLSARSPEALRDLARSWVDFLADAPYPLADIAHSAGARREHHDHRLAVLARTAAEARESLEAFLRGEESSAVLLGQRTPGRRSRLAFVFSGQGPQWRGMGRQLLAREPVFRTAVERCDALLRPLVGWSLLDQFRCDEPASRLHRTEVAQPALFALQVGLAELWRSWGVVPQAVVGHSLGEVAAAHVAGALTLEDAVRVVAHRGRVMQKAAGRGRTAAVDVPADEALHALKGLEEKVNLAAVNGPSSVTLSGDPEALEEVLGSLRHKGAVTHLLRTDCAFHSYQMDALVPELVAALDGTQPQAASLPLVSSVTGLPAAGPELDADYWGRNLRQTVRFADAVGGLLERRHEVFLEIGPHPVLAQALNQCLEARGKEGVVLPSLRRGEEDHFLLLRSLAALYVRGLAVDWGRVRPGGRFVRLPSYPWQRERCWLEHAPEKTASGHATPPAEVGSHPLLGRHLSLAHLPGVHVWEKSLGREEVSFFGGSSAGGAVLLPASAWVEMALAAAEGALGPGVRALADAEFPAPLYLPEKGKVAVQVVLSPAGAAASFDIYGRATPADDWTLHATGKVRPADGAGL
jgi:acyl transferase domain-containing protein